MSKFAFKLGVECSDKVTGFTGVVTARCQYITGCNQYSLTPQELQGGKVPDSAWFDENRITKTAGKGLSPKDFKSEDKGADVPAPSKH